MISFFGVKKKNIGQQYKKIILFIGGAGYVGKAFLKVCNDQRDILFVVVSRSSTVTADNVILIRTDLTKNPEESIKKILNITGRIDIVIHAAAVYAFETAASLTAEKIAREFEVNTMLPLLVTQEVYRQYWALSSSLENKKEGRKVIIIGSRSGDGKGDRDDLIIYSATKAALFSAWQYYEDFLTQKGVTSIFLKPGSLREKDSLDSFVQELKNAVVYK